VNLRTARRSFVTLRLLVGATFAGAPELAHRRWLGSTPRDTAASVPLRAMGVRDVALSVGALAADRVGGNPAAWLRAAAAAEAADALAVLAVRRDIPARARTVAAVGPAVLAVVALALARPRQ
jgi:hypothetical protein